MVCEPGLCALSDMAQGVICLPCLVLFRPPGDNTQTHFCSRSEGYYPVGIHSDQQALLLAKVQI